MAYKMNGTIFQIDNTKQITDSFKNRELILRVDGQHTQEIKFTAIQNRVDMLDEFKVFDEVEITFDIQGKSSKNKQTNELVWYNTLILFQIKKV